MGLLEDLLGSALGGAQQNDTPAQQGQSGGMSPIMLALMALMAYRAMSSGNAPPQQAPSRKGWPGRRVCPGASGDIPHSDTRSRCRHWPSLAVVDRIDEWGSEIPGKKELQQRHPVASRRCKFR